MTAKLCRLAIWRRGALISGQGQKLSVKRTLADSQPFRRVYEIYFNV